MGFGIQQWAAGRKNAQGRAFHRRGEGIPRIPKITNGGIPRGGHLGTPAITRRRKRVYLRFPYGK